MVVNLPCTRMISTSRKDNLFSYSVSIEKHRDLGKLEKTVMIYSTVIRYFQIHWENSYCKVNLVSDFWLKSADFVTFVGLYPARKIFISPKPFCKVSFYSTFYLIIMSRTDVKGYYVA